MGGRRPQVWISDRYSAQQKHGERHQTCLAHLARDAAFAFEHGSDDLPLRFKLWFGKAFDLARGIADVAASTLARKKRAMEKQLGVLLAAPTGCDLARELQAKIGRARDQLLIFLRLSRRRRHHEQHVGAKTSPMRDPKKSHKRLARHVGHPSRSRRANDRRHRAPQRRQPLQRYPRDSRLNNPKIATPPFKKSGWVIAGSLTILIGIE